MINIKVRLLLCLVLLTNLFCSSDLYAWGVSDLNSGRYAVYYGDFDNNGYGDIYFHGKELFVPIYSDILVPIILPPEQSFVVYRHASGYAAPAAANISVAGLTEAPANSVYQADFNGDNRSDLLIRGATSASPALILAGAGDNNPPSILVDYGNTPLSNHNLSNRSYNILISDINGDGKDDIKIEGGSIDHVYLANSSGVPSNYLLLEEENELTIKAEGAPYKGRLSVNPVVGKDGSFNASVAIEVPPGINGMEPKLSLNYNSNHRDGILGLGWSIGGLSSITRCRASHARDTNITYNASTNTLDQSGAIGRYSAQANLDNLDQKLCLNGKRLVAVNGSSGTEYRTEQESFVRIVPVGVRGGGAKYFEVHRPDGQVITYGFSLSARRETSLQTAFSWSIEKIRDIAGNEMLFHYQSNQATGEQYIEKITYTQNGSLNLNHSVNFDYDSQERPDVSVNYIAGTKISLRKRLSSIKVKANGNLIREYKLDYENNAYDSLGISRLERLVLCFDQAGSSCAEGLTFQWDDFPEQPVDQSAVNSESTFYPLASLQKGDFDGDGQLDTIVSRAVDPLDLSAGEEYLVDLSADSENFISWLSEADRQKLSLNTKIAIYDINNDGLSDLLAGTSEGSEWKVYAFLSTGQHPISTGSGGFESGVELLSNPSGSIGFRFSDLNGDRKIDLYRDTQNSETEMNVRLNTTGLEFGDETTWLDSTMLDNTIVGTVDINGDQLPDLVRLVESNFDHAIRVAINQGDGKTFSDFENQLDMGNTGGRQHYVAGFADFNGDGLKDYIIRFYEGQYSDGFYIAINNGGTFSPLERWIADFDRVDGEFKPGQSHVSGFSGNLLFRDFRGSILYVDMNGDGKTDIVGLGESGAWVSLSTGLPPSQSSTGGFLPKQLWYPGMSKNTLFTVQDIDRNGIFDISTPTLLPKHHLKSITDSVGISVAVDYVSLSNSEGVYEKVATSDDRVRVSNARRELETGLSMSESTYKIQDARHVVKNYSRRNGLEDLMITSYKYKGMLEHITGYGALGFSEIEETTHMAGLGNQRKVSEYLQDFDDEGIDRYKLSGFLKRQRIYAKSLGSNEQLLSDTRNQWKVRVYNDDLDANVVSPHFFPYLYQSSVESWDLNGAKISNRLMQVQDTANFSCSPLSQTQNDTVLTTTSLDEDYSLYGVRLYSRNTVCDESGTIQDVVATATENLDIINIDGRDLVRRVDTHAYVASSLSGLAGSKQTRRVDSNYYLSNSGNNRAGQLQSTIVEPAGSADLRYETTYNYNVYGTVSDITETVVSFTDDAIDFTSRTSSINETIATDGERTVVSTNPLGHTETTLYDARFGLPTEQTDNNGLVTSTYYDEVGRVDYINYPDGSSTTNDYIVCRNCFDYSIYEQWYVESQTTGQAAERTYFDDFDRIVGNRTTGLNGINVYTVQEYNIQGELALVSDPFYSSNDRVNTQSSFDILGRSVRMDYPDASFSTTAYNGLTLTKQNRLGQQQVELKNGFNWVMRSADNAGTPVDFIYTPWGDVETTQINNNVATNIVIGYDDLGRKTTLNDPNTGLITYRYNAFGLLASEEDAEGQVTRYQYDELGRQIQRIDDATASDAAQRTHIWAYDTAPGKGIGQLASLNGYNTDGSTFSESYKYNPFGLLEETTSNFAGKTFITTQLYDAYSRPQTTIYPSGYTTINNYNSYGYIDKVISNGTAIWEAQDVDARGNITHYVLGNGVQTVKDFDPNTGFISSIVASKGAIDVQNQAYYFDSIGNLTSRTDNRDTYNIIEDFCYDNMNRLTAEGFDGNCGSVDQTYDALGNILTKAGIADIYGYGNNAGPNAVTSVGSKTYQYNNNGNLVSDSDGTSITYSAFNKPTTISKSGKSTTVVYGPHKDRIQRTDSDGRTTYYGSLGIYEETTLAGTTEKVHYVGDFALYIEQSGVNNDSHYLYQHRDHLGSIVAQSNETVAAAIDIKAMANGAWGERRQAVWEGLEEGANYIPAGTARGFTDHEHLDGVGLIHMNGRVYDPQLGRFVSPDPLVQAPYNTQSYNRYSYVFNNPLSFIDPTGYKGQRVCTTTTGENGESVRHCTEGGSGGGAGSTGVLSLTAFASLRLFSQISLTEVSAVGLSSTVGIAVIGLTFSEGLGEGSDCPTVASCTVSDSDSGGQSDEEKAAQEKAKQKALETKGQSTTTGTPSGGPDDPNKDKKTDHGKKRAEEAKTDPNRNVGDGNKVVREGTKYRDTKTGNDVYVKGDRVVVFKNGRPHSQFKNSRANTRARVKSGRWERQ